MYAWIDLRGDEPGPLFGQAVKGGAVHIGQPISTEVVTRCATAAGVSAARCHDLRRTFIGEALDAGADIATVARLVGHAQVTTTARYDRRGERAERQAAGLVHVPYVAPAQRPLA